MRTKFLIAVLGTAVGCTAPDEGFTPLDVDQPGTTTCPEPVAGFGRLSEQAEARGITPDTTPPSELIMGSVWSPGRVAAEDLDGDGDMDLIFGHSFGRPQLFANDGTGRFRKSGLESIGPLPGNAARQPWATFSVVDLVGDSLPDLVVQGGHDLFVAENLGDLVFASLQVAGTVPGARTTIYQHTWGDPDGDGDLDVWIPTMSDLESSVAGSPVAEQYLVNEGGSLVAGHEYLRRDEAGLSFLGAWSDRDNDGDLDLLSYSDRSDQIGVLGTSYRNDGGVDHELVLADDGSDVGLAVPISAMGMDSADLNGDGVLDYCTTDIGPVSCLLSSNGQWIEAGLVLGLEPPPRELSPWSAWGLELVDLDHDGILDMGVSGAAPGPELIELGTDDEWWQPDVLYQGTATGFERRDDAPFGSGSPHPGLVAADLDGNGFQDLVLAGWDEPAEVWMNPCNGGAWLVVEPRGAPGNHLGLGARVTVDDGERQRLRDIQGQRVFGQGPARAHFGLAEAEVVDVTVRWPDGVTVELDAVSARQRLVVQYPG